MTIDTLSKLFGKIGTRAFKGAGLTLIVIVAFAAYTGGALRPVDDALAHLRFAVLDRPASHTLTVVEIDVPSLRAAGQWPWSRARYAKAIDNLINAGAELVAFDVDFSARSTESADEAMEASLRRRPGTVVLPTFVQPVTRGGVKQLEGTSPLASLSDQAILASVNVPVDTDGEVRSYKYGFATGDQGRLTVAATLAGSLPGRTDSFLIDYGIHARDIDRLSFEAAYTGRFDPALVRGRKILIGATALELGDEFTTPKGTMPGVFVHALAYESLRAGRALVQLKLPVLVVLAGLCVYCLRPRSTLVLTKMLRRHLLVAGGALLVPLVIQAVFPLSMDASPILTAQALCLFWATRAELKRRAQAVVDAREAHLVQIAAHMRQSRDEISAANTKLRHANEALDKALKARTEFLAATSHEIRTPLNGILGMTQVILADRGLADGVRDKVGLVQSAGETMLALVSDILDVAKIETGAMVIEPVEMDLHKLLQDTGRLWSETANAKGLSLVVDYAQTPSWISEDPTRLRQIVFNLMSNALKFTEEGQVGFIGRVEQAEAGETLVLEVSDSGIGIPADKMEDIFESFRQVDGSVTRKYGGTGLGLAICRQLALAMGGEITVRSQVGEGSVFTVRLPLRRVESKAEGQSIEQSALSTSLETSAVLLAEANPLAQSMLKAALAQHVSSIEAVGSLHAALEAMQARRYDLVLAEGKTLASGDADAADGIARLADGSAGARISVLWAGAPEDMQRLLVAGASHVARKPISTGDLVAELKALCSSAQQVHDPSSPTLTSAA